MYDEKLIEFLHLVTWPIDELSPDVMRSHVRSGIPLSEVRRLLKDVRKTLN